MELTRRIAMAVRDFKGLKSREELEVFRNLKVLNSDGSSWSTGRTLKQPANPYLELALSCPLIISRKNCLMTLLLMWYSSHLHGEQFPITCNKTTYFHIDISISECFLIDIRLFSLAPVRNAVTTYNSWLLPHITIQPLHQLWIAMVHKILYYIIC